MENPQAAIPPTFNNIPQFIKEIKQGEKENSNTFIDRDKMFALLSETDEWVELKKYIESRIGALRKLLNYNVEGAKLEDIGLRFLVADLASAELEAIIKKVEYAKEYIEKQKTKGVTRAG